MSHSFSFSSCPRRLFPSCVSAQFLNTRPKSACIPMLELILITNVFYLMALCMHVHQNKMSIFGIHFECKSGSRPALTHRMAKCLMHTRRYRRLFLLHYLYLFICIGISTNTTHSRGLSANSQVSLSKPSQCNSNINLLSEQ